MIVLYQAENIIETNNNQGKKEEDEAIVAFFFVMEIWVTGKKKTGLSLGFATGHLHKCERSFVVSVNPLVWNNRL
jgi:hypothetical protein